MPPNLGGFFMVRSYYPSECHADYFDFERIEALKPAIEACGISRSEERFSRNAETDLVCRLLLEKKKKRLSHCHHSTGIRSFIVVGETNRLPDPSTTIRTVYLFADAHPRSVF